jgi:hypothetical protein
MPDEIVTFLKRVKILIKAKRRRFSNRTINGLNYKEILLNDFGITVLEAWNQILSLHPREHYPDNKFSYEKRSDAYIFKRIVSGVNAYIKIKIEYNKNNQEEVVCVSFHKDKGVK